MVEEFTYLFLQFADQFVVLFQQFLGHFNFELLAGRILNFQTVIASIGDIGEFQVILDFAQLATGEDAHEYFVVCNQFLEVNFSVLGHDGQFFGQGGQSAIVIQQQGYLILGLDETVAYVSN